MKEPKIPYIAFLGRWCPFHKGHIAMIRAGMKMNPGARVLVLIKDTDYDEIPIGWRQLAIEAWMEKESIDGEVLIVPNIVGLYYGRKVGYHVDKIEVPEDIKGISATQIRQKIKDGKSDWRDLLALPETASAVEFYLSGNEKPK